MRLSDKTLLIVANPFAAPLSAEGRATALCPADPAEGGGRYVGTRTTATVRKQPRGMRSPFGTRDKVMVYYDLRPIQVADTSYYRNAVKAGDVLVHANDNYNRAAAIISDPKVIATLRAYEQGGRLARMTTAHDVLSADFKFDLKSVIADNCSSTRFVLGGQMTPLAGLDLRTLGVVMEKNGEPVAIGAGAAVLGPQRDKAGGIACKARFRDIGIVH